MDLSLYLSSGECERHKGWLSFSKGFLSTNS